MIPMIQQMLTLLPQLIQGFVLLVVILLMELTLLILVVILLLAGVASLLEALAQTGAISSQNAPALGTQGAQGGQVTQTTQPAQGRQEYPSSTRSRHWFSVRPDCSQLWFCIWSSTDQSDRNTNHPPSQWVSAEYAIPKSSGPDYGSWPLQLAPTELATAKFFPPQTVNTGMVSGNLPQSGYGQNNQQPSAAAMNTNIPQGGMTQQPGAMGAPGTGHHLHGVHTPPQVNPTGAHTPGQGNQTVNNQQQGGNGQGPHPPPPGGYHAVPPGNRLYQQAAPYDPNNQFPNNAQQPIGMQPNIPPGYARIPPNPNLPPGFDPQAFQIGGTKTNLGTIGKLGDELLWDEWLMRVEGQLNCNWWAYLIDDPLCPPHVWHTVKMWVIQWLNKADSQQVLRCHSWAEAKDKIRRNHSPDDATTINQINEMLMAARLGASEPPSSS
jgi:hypothetical protein